MTTKIEKPILFSGEMVRAILEGRKTETRRPVKRGIEIGTALRGSQIVFNAHDAKGFLVQCPYGRQGDRLWVKETWGYRSTLSISLCEGECSHRHLAYRFSEPDAMVWHWTPPLYMPRWASRITLEITGVKVERVQDTSHRDALAEGVSYDVSKSDGSPLARFQTLWDSINAKRGYGWQDNPWVWVIAFRRA